MSGLGWKLRRLGAMSAAEIAHRTRAALRDRLAAPAWSRWSAAETGARWFADAGRPVLPRERWSQVAHVPDRGACEATLAAAERLAAGKWTLFGREVALGEPPRWNVAPATGAEWPESPSAAIDYRRTDLPGGAKAVWEAGRLTMLPTLALAARLESGAAGAAHADRARRWLADFVTRNPLGHGVHHTSGIEMAIRVITIGWTLALLDRENGSARATGAGSPQDDGARAAAALMAQQALWCRDHLSLGSSANNHLLAEYAAMVVAGAGLPALPAARALLDAGLEGLAREIPLQIHADGVSAEQAFRYLPFVWELVLPALRLAEAAGRAVPEPVRARLAASLEFARWLRRDDGRLPPVGDEDDARILLADESATRLDLAGNALATWLGVPPLAPGARGLAVLLTGCAGGEAWPAPDGQHVFAHGGVTVWRSGSALATFDHGPLGLGTLAAHGHADALSLTLRLGGDELVIDPGTLAYHEDETRRLQTRATRFHSTVNFGGRDQSEMLGPFLWGRRARVAADGDAWRCTWWTGEAHVRRVTFAAGEIAIEDRVVGPAPEIVFALAPGARVTLDGRRAEVAAGGSMLRLDAEGIGEWRVEESEVAEGFGRRLAARRLAARMTEREARTRLGFGPR